MCKLQRASVTAQPNQRQSVLGDRWTARLLGQGPPPLPGPLQPPLPPQIAAGDDDDSGGVDRVVDYREQPGCMRATRRSPEETGGRATRPRGSLPPPSSLRQHDADNERAARSVGRTTPLKGRRTAVTRTHACSRRYKGPRAAHRLGRPTEATGWYRRRRSRLGQGTATFNSVALSLAAAACMSSSLLSSAADDDVGWGREAAEFT